MIRKIHTRGETRQKYYHENSGDINKISGNSVIRPPTSHPYSAYKNSKSESQLRCKYSQTYFLESKIQNYIQQISKNLPYSGFIQKLPASIRHTFNQLKASVKNQLKNLKCSQIDNLIQSIAKILYQSLQDKKIAQKQNMENLEKMKELQQQISKLHKKYDHYQKSESKNRWKKKSLKYGQEILLENCRLGEMNLKYLARISQLENRKQKYCEVEYEEKDSSNKFDTQVLRCHNRISYLQIKLNTAQKTEGQLVNKLEALEEQKRYFKQKNIELIQENKRLNEKMNQWREKAMMQKQDGEIQISRQQFLLYSLRKLRENNKNLLQKLLAQNSLSSQKIDKKSYVQNTNFEYQMDFFKNLSTLYQKGKGQKLFSVQQVKKNQIGVQIQETLFDAEYHNYKKQDKFSVNQLKFYRPSFFAFLQQSLTTDLAQCRKKEGTSVSRIFIQILRGIMNSKLNQFLYVDTVEKFTKFPQFVYAWFEKFYFSSQKKSVLMLQPFMQKPISQQNFYRDLMNVKLDQSWEIITFREFLLQELSLQQLYFYLLCQHLLYTRAGITKQVLYHGDFNILVEYSAAKAVLDITLNDFESWNITFLNSKLRQKLIIKNKCEMVEAGFFLRCLTEYYRIERSNRYRYISKLSSQFKDHKKGLRFSSFMSIINKFTELPMQHKLKVYRDCYCITKGVITPESIFTICNQNLIFLKYLKMKSFFRFPKIITKSPKYSLTAIENQTIQKNPSTIQNLCLHPSEPYLYSIILEFKKTIEEENSLIAKSQSLGVSEIINQILQMMRALDQRNSEINSNILKCKHFIHYFSEMMEKVRRVTFVNFYELLEEQWKKRNKQFWVEISESELGEIFAQEIKATFNAYHRINEIRIWKNKIYNFRVHNAARKIQKQIKKKFIQPYEHLYKYLNNEKKSEFMKESENKQHHNTGSDNL